MNKLLIIFFSVLLSLSSTQGQGDSISNSGDLPVDSNSSISSNIPTNASVNVAWGGRMCEANGAIYYVTACDSQQTITRMNQDGSNPTVVTDEYYYISNLTSDSNNLYFAVSSESSETDIIYRLPLNGGQAQKVTEGNVRALQNVNGQLYWEDYNSPTGVITSDTVTTIQIKSINPDGTDLKTPLTLTVSDSTQGEFNFLATAEGIYYSIATANTSDYNYYSDIYHIDLSGENPVKLNHDTLGCVDNLFYDQNKLYLLVENDFSADPFSSSILTLDQEGKTKTVLSHVGYFPQDFACIEYCGISNGIIYYFVFQETSNTSANLLLDFHQYDMNKNKDDIIKSGVDMGDSAVGTIASLRGKSMKGNSNGMYILGNDIYFEPFQMP